MTSPTGTSTSTSTSTPLTRKELRNVTFLVLAFSCVIASLTIIVGSGAVVILSVAESRSSLAPFPLAAVFMGMSLISFLATHWIFARWGRKIGFWIGSCIGIIGVVVGCWGLVESSAGLVLLAQTICGAGLGMGMYVRYSGAEVVAKEHSAKAMTWVLAGGCLAAFVGPEVSQATAGLFGDEENVKYMGTFVVAGGFCLLHSLCVGMVEFPPTMSPPPPPPPLALTLVKETDLETASPSDMPTLSPPLVTLQSIMTQSSFLLPLGIAILSWALMAMPMSIFRITMRDVGFSERQSLTVIEFHFLSMYAPGFWSGDFIKQNGLLRTCQTSVLGFILSLGVLLSLPSNTKTTAGWYIGFILLGIAWNLGFSAATVWSTQSYEHAPYLKAKVQAANECLMFLVSGALMFSTGYIYDNAGGGDIAGWRLLNGLLFVLVGIFVGLVVVAPRPTTTMTTTRSLPPPPHPTDRPPTVGRGGGTAEMG